MPASRLSGEATARGAVVVVAAVDARGSVEEVGGCTCGWTREVRGASKDGRSVGVGGSANAAGWTSRPRDC